MASHPERSGTEERRLQSTAPALEPERLPSSDWTAQPDEHVRGQQGRKRKSSDSAAGRECGHVMRENVARDHARVQYGDAYDRLDMSQRVGHRFDGGQASGSARVQNGDQYQYGAVHHHNYAATASPLPERSGDQAQSRIALAMEFLSFTQMDVRQESVRKAHTNTCKWLFDKPEYINWRNDNSVSDHNGFFWIKSKPGAGKSTLMKFFLHSASTQLPGETIISFFFNARSSEALEKSLEGLYRGLLHQLLTAVPRLQKFLEAASTANGAQYGWSLDSLKMLFSQAIMSLGEVKLTCFIDALDECPEAEIRDMIEFFEDLGESAASDHVKLRVCFSSRHYPNVTMRKCQHMTLDGQEGHNEDITKYVKSKLKVRAGKAADGIRTALQDKAKGVFMWVVLVVRILNEQSDHGGNNAELRRCLNQIPGELHELFEEILQRGMQSNRYLIPLLQWLLFARRPLTREELYFALRSEDQDFNVSTPWDPREDDIEAMDLFILNASKGLAERTKGKKPTMQFIHESVRDYLRNTGFRTLAPGLHANLEGLSHDHLKSRCLVFLNRDIFKHLALPSSFPKAKSEEAKALRHRASDLYPFLEYAIKCLIFHADLASSCGVSQSGFVVNSRYMEDEEAGFELDLWCTFSDMFAMYDTRRQPIFRHPMMVFAQSGARHLTETALGAFPRPFVTDPFSEALLLAVKFGHINVVTFFLGINVVEEISDTDEHRILFQSIVPKDTTILTALLKAGIPRSKMFLDTSKLLLQASKAGSARAVQLLSDHGADIAEHGAKALIVAIRDGQGDVVKALLENGLDANESLGRWISLACTFGHEDILRTLLQHGSHAEVKSFGHDPLLGACRSGHIGVVQILLDDGRYISSAPESQEEGDLNPVFIACRRGHSLVARLLLEKDAYLATKDLLSCLELSFVQKDTHLIRLLFDRNADVNALWAPHVLTNLPDGLSISRSLMFAASLRGDEATLKLLFEYGADVNVSNGREYYDALSSACQSGLEGIIGILLSVCEALKPEHHCRMIEEATNRQHSEMVRLLFSRDGGRCTQHRDLYVGSLRVALDRGFDDIAGILIANGVRLPEEDYLEEYLYQLPGHSSE